jgi:hypothetical protein
VDSCLSFCMFSLATILSVLRTRAYDYPFGTFKLFSRYFLLSNYRQQVVVAKFKFTNVVLLCLTVTGHKVVNPISFISPLGHIVIM